MNRERGFQLRTDQTGRQLIVALIVPVIVAVRESDIPDVGRVVSVLRARPVPVCVVGAELYRW